MSERCHICNASMAEHRCYRCGGRVCSSCIDENGLLCKRCKLVREEDEEVKGVRIGYAPLRRMVNIPLFVAGIAAIIIGMIVIGASISVSPPVTAPEQMPEREPGGSIYIFPFPFVIAWGSPDAMT
ncbi:MAG: hypothetical protein ACE5JV_02880, partial [Nitrososphaerales archaeon]